MKPVCCKVSSLDPKDTFKTKGLFLGLVGSESGESMAVVWHENHGMSLQTYHPSRVELTPGEP